MASKSKHSSARKQASEFYDGYHVTSDQQGDDHPVRRKTAEIQRGYLRQLNPQPNSRLLDLSCGLGYFLREVSKERPDLKLEGLDHSAYAVKAAMSRAPQARYKVGDAMATGYPARSFDTVTCLGSLEHYPDSGKGLAEISRILKDDGRALIYVPNLFFVGYIYLVWRTGETPHEAGQNEYERFETRQGWEDLIKKHGLRVVKVTKHNEMYATERVPAWMRLIYAWFIEPFVPLNLSYCFGFYVEKIPAATR